MRGHIRRRGKAWVVVVDVGRAETGKRQQRWHTFRTKRDAESALADILSKLAHDEYVPPSNVTVGDYVREVWLPHLVDQVEAGVLRPSTVAQYRSLSERHVVPNLGGVRLRSLSASMLDRFYAELLRGGRRVRPDQAPTGLSTTTVHAVHVTVSKMLKHALRKGVLTRNIAQLADPPRPMRTEQRIWSLEETVRFLDATKGDRLYPLYLLAVTTGLRRGELAGVRWSNVDLEAGTVTVSGARVVVDYKVVESGPKTAKGRRSIAIARTVVEALQEQHTRQQAEILAWGPAWTDTGLVFTREDGTGLHPQYVTLAFQRAAKRAGLPVLPLHALRHGHATAGLRAGVDLHTMSRRLGHSSVAVTGDIYSHVVEELDREAADRTADLLLADEQGGEGPLV